METHPRLYPITIMLVAVLTLAFAWVGWLDSDDKNHLVGAYGWLEHFPYIATDHAALRHTIAIPVGMSFRTFGISEFSLIIPNMIQYFGMIFLTWHFLRTSLNERVALLACLLIATVPLFPIFASVVFTETTELFYLALSFWLFHTATLRDRKVLLLLLAGLSAGFAWLTRETTAALLLFYGVLFLMGYGMPRKYYWVMAGGFLLIVGAEAITMAILTGDPLYRYEIVLNKQGNILYKGTHEGEVFNRIGNLSVNPILDPLLVLFANHEFGLLFFVAVPAAIWSWNAKGQSSQQRNTLRLLLLWGVVWFLFVSTMLTNLHQRYYTVCAYVAAILVANWLAHGLSGSQKRLTILLIMAIFGANFAAIYVDNRNPLFGERALVEFVKNSDQEVYTDPVTLRRAAFFLKNAGLTDRVNSTPPPSKSLLYFNPNRARDLQREVKGFESYLPKKDWEIVWENSEGRKVTGLILEGIGLRSVIPASIYTRLNQPNQAVTVYRVP